MSKLLVTGGTGYIGSRVVAELLATKMDVTLLVRPTTEISRIPKGCRIVVNDGDSETLQKTFEKERFDGVVHLASLATVRVHDVRDVAPLISTNICLSTLVLDVAVRTGVKWFLNVGTFWQHYDNSEYSPVNLYAATKEAFISLAQYYAETAMVKIVTIELNDTYGPDDPRPKILNLWKERMESGELLKMSPGEQVLDICYIDDVVAAFKQMISLLESEDERVVTMERYAVYSGERMTLKELAQKFESVVGKKVPIDWGALPYRKRDVMVPQNRIQPVPGWCSEVSFEHGIQKILNEGVQK